MRRIWLGWLVAVGLFAWAAGLVVGAAQVPKSDKALAASAAIHERPSELVTPAPEVNSKAVVWRTLSPVG